MSGSRPSSALGYPYPTRPLYPWASPNPCPQAEGPFEPWLGCLAPVPWTPPSVHPRSPAEPHAGALRLGARSCMEAVQHPCASPAYVGRGGLLHLGGSVRHLWSGQERAVCNRQRERGPSSSSAGGRTVCKLAHSLPDGLLRRAWMGGLMIRM